MFQVFQQWQANSLNQLQMLQILLHIPVSTKEGKKKKENGLCT